MGWRIKLGRTQSLWVGLLPLLAVTVIGQQWFLQSTLYGENDTLVADQPVEMTSEAKLRATRGTDNNNDTAPCQILKGTRQMVKEPAFVANYPGSGSELTMNLIESLTGIKTIAHGGRCDPPETPYDYVALKTHYPWHCRKEGEWEHGALSRAVVLIRNPISAIPSKANRVHEETQNTKAHSAQAPKQFWITWRDRKFATELSRWEELIHYWFQQYTPENRLFIPYEHLVSGPEATQELGRFFNVSHNIDCIWQGVVVGDKSSRRSNIHRKKTYTPEFTLEQYDSILDVLGRLSKRYEQESFGGSFQEYAKAVEEKMEAIKTPKQRET